MTPERGTGAQSPWMANGRRSVRLTKASDDEWVGEDVQVLGSEARRYRPVRLPRRSVNLSAAVEDHVSGELIRVANASMALRLAELMNDENEGKPLPPRGTQH